ncbi:MAG: aminomethyl-transferring glycine dehydrogenase subunit GcvPB [Candidatus Bathyarchaeota archaeon]|nr:aminomethyl-transferring glycine dehydrogenase subunit GcvPB [Candidatus Bathyarchaeota archaeon]
MTVRKFRQADWDEPLVFELSHEGRYGFHPPEVEEEIRDKIKVERLIPKKIARATPAGLPEVSEMEILRHYIHLSQMNYGVNSGLIYPLGSCTMKYNPIINEVLAGHPMLTGAHPDQDTSTVQGILEFLYKLKQGYLSVTGMDDATLQPAAGAHGEWTGIMLIRAYHQEHGDLAQRTDIIVPDSAHGTNPASAAMAGLKIIEVPSGPDGCINLDALRAVVGPQTAGLMLTNPNTLGLFDHQIAEIAEIIHKAGGLMYYDGANLNAIMGKCRPGDMGFDVVHVNLHKTFSTPHGGGGPGSGPVGCKSILAKYLPVPDIVYKEGKYSLSYNKPQSIGKVHGYYGNVNVMLKAYTYMLTMGPNGLKEASELSVLNANYIARKLKDTKGLSLPFAPEKPRMHEVALSAQKLNEDTGVRSLNLAKNLLDYGLHAPTIYFPLIVPEALMVEPTETEPVEALDDFIDVVKKTCEVAYTNPQEALKAPVNTVVGKLDEAKAAHPKTICLSWRRLCQLNEE